MGRSVSINGQASGTTHRCGSNLTPASCRPSDDQQTSSRCADPASQPIWSARRVTGGDRRTVLRLPLRLGRCARPSTPPRCQPAASAASAARSGLGVGGVHLVADVVRHDVAGDEEVQRFHVGSTSPGAPAGRPVKQRSEPPVPLRHRPISVIRPSQAASPPNSASPPRSADQQGRLTTRAG